MLARRLFGRLLARLGYQQRLFLEVSLDDDVADVTSRAVAQVRELVEEDADAFVEFRDGPDKSLFLSRIRAGQQCFAAIVDERIASVSWVARDTATLWAFNAVFKLDPGALYVFDSYTHPDYRGQRLQASVFEAIRSTYANYGIRKIVTFVESTNVSNLRSRARLGFEVTGRVRRYRFGQWSRFTSFGNSPILAGRARAARGER